MLLIPWDPLPIRFHLTLPPLLFIALLRRFFHLTSCPLPPRSLPLICHPILTLRLPSLPLAFPLVRHPFNPMAHPLRLLLLGLLPLSPLQVVLPAPCLPLLHHPPAAVSPRNQRPIKCLPQKTELSCTPSRRLTKPQTEMGAAIRVQAPRMLPIPEADIVLAQVGCPVSLEVWGMYRELEIKRKRQDRR